MRRAACRWGTSLVLVTILSSACSRQPVESEPIPVPTIPAPALSPAEVEYFDSHSLMVPVEGISPKQLRDSFNEPRSDGRTHRATDILAPRGTPVLAAIAGEVARMSQSSLGGITVYLIDAGRRYVYYYAHLDRYSDQLTPGLKVEQGTVIGYVGTSGNAPPDTPHLHFQAMRLRPGQRDWWNGVPVDVRSFMTKKGKVLE